MMDLRMDLAKRAPGVLLVAALLGLGGHATVTAAAAPPADKLPREVTALLARMETCHHWAGEEPYDADRAAEIARGMQKAGCGRLDADERRLLRKYREQRAVTQALQEARQRLQ